MTIANLIARECVLIRRDPTGTLDDYGNETTLDYTTDSVCELQQRGANERDDAGETSDDTYSVFFLSTEDLTTASAVQVGGEVYEFTGAPWIVYHPLDKTNSHIEVKARRTAGANDGGS